MFTYSRNNPIALSDPSGLVPCSGGVWSQGFGDFQVSGAFGGHFSAGRANFTCRSNPSAKCTGFMTCIGGGVILGGGITWNLLGVVGGAPASSALAGWSGWQTAGSVGPVNFQVPPGGGGNASIGVTGGAGLAQIRCYTSGLQCKPCGP